MGLYSKAIRKKEEDNQKYEQYADESLLNDKAMLKLEEGVDDAQTTVLYILGKFGIQMDRLYGLRNVDEMLEMMLKVLMLILIWLIKTPICLNSLEKENVMKCILQEEFLRWIQKYIANG